MSAADEAVVHIVWVLANLVLECGQVGELPQGCHHGKDRMQFGDFRYMRLDEHDGFQGSNPCREEIQGHLSSVLPQILGVFDCRERMQVHDAIYAVVVILQRHVVPDGA